ncbi:hypothetical protein EZV62_014515 [Acer yangbiense]|uniref:Uncharacterized protein n=1 Tax=Acer yangbiense TaxID=1000413 RepID=A0A5C7HUU8_9ROSI|nr:hypothetical protein EZV62_014515 [Acer yangbiense]
MKCIDRFLGLSSVYNSSSCGDLGYKPTSNHIVDDQKLGCFHKRVNRDMVKRCYNLVKRNVENQHLLFQKFLEAY